ncbi:MAG: CDP-alcohol phosphatidyltransferase family protein [Lysobacterales bacterium]|nr:MAG: CDP-alcohol phosphatidyltransferase family protein [Xanthomonadales bacterium]
MRQVTEQSTPEVAVRAGDREHLKRRGGMPPATGTATRTRAQASGKRRCAICSMAHSWLLARHGKDREYPGTGTRRQARQPARTGARRDRTRVNMWLTWANLLTLCRFCLAVPCALAVAEADWALAAALFALAVATDLLDGPLARRLAQATPLGGLLDHATDAWFVSATLAGLACTGATPWLLPLLVVAAFLQYMLDSKALLGRPLRASWLGRWNGIAYFMLAGALVLHHALALSWPGPAIWSGLGWLLVASTLASMANRAIAWRRAKQFAVGFRQE